MLPSYNSWSLLGMQVGLSGSLQIVLFLGSVKNGLFEDNYLVFAVSFVTKLAYTCWNKLLTKYLNVSFVPLDAFVLLFLNPSHCISE